MNDWILKVSNQQADDQVVGLSDPLFQCSLWIGVVASVLILLALARIVSLRLHLLASQRQKQLFLNQWRPVIVRWLAGNERQILPALEAIHRTAFLLLWMHFHESLRGDATKSLNRLAVSAGVQEFLPGLLLLGSADDRLIAAAAAGHLRLPEYTNALWHFARSPGCSLSLTATRSLCQIHGARAAKKVVPLMVARTDWPLARIASILAESGLDFVHRYVRTAERLYRVEPEKLPRLLKALSVVELNRPLRLVRWILEGEEAPDLTAAALRLVNHPDELPLVRARLRDSYWSVRVQAVTKLGVLGNVSDVNAIAELLHDYKWWVRYRAAHALKRLPGVGTDHLRRIFNEALDPFARDMLKQVAAESGEEIAFNVFENDRFGGPLSPQPAV
ncbi:MAG: hypothetical protein FIA97_02735 [Methylococcaceae bacterium]|nr:hypothetical protein [Methylococcaceae bacterium]